MVRKLLTTLLLVTAFSAQVFAEGVDPTKLREFKAKAEQGDVDAQFGLGLMYVKGEGVPQNYQEAAKWFTLAAEQGDARAQFGLGVLYHNGEGVPQNYQEAAKWFTLAAEQGFARAQFGLGVLYHKGKGVPQNYIQAHRWANLAAANAIDEESRKENMKLRDKIASKMSREDIATAQRLAEEKIK